GLLMWGLGSGLFLLTALDLYRPATLFRLHVVGEALMAAAMLHMALLFPQAHRYARLRVLGYLLALAIVVAYEVFLYRAPAYSTVLNVDMACLALATLFFVSRSVFEYWRGRSQLAWQRVRVVTLGMLFGFAMPAILLLLSAFMGGGVAMNPAAFTPFLFALSL